MAFLTGTLVGLCTTGDNVCYLLPRTRYLIIFSASCLLVSMFAPCSFRKNCCKKVLYLLSDTKTEQFLWVLLQIFKLSACKTFNLSHEKLSLTFRCFIYCSRLFFIWFSFLSQFTISFFATSSSWN